MTWRKEAATQPGAATGLTAATTRPAGPGQPPATLPPALLVCYLGALALVEWLLTVSVPAAAAGFGLLALAACAGLAFAPGEPGAALLPALVAVPVVRLGTVAAPTADLTPLGRLAVLAAFTLVVVVVAARGHRSTPGPRAPARAPTGRAAQAAVPLVAAPLALVVYPLEPPAPELGAGVSPAVLALVLAFAVIPDELLFRGLLTPAASAVAGPAGVPLAAAAYAATFLGYGSAGTVLAALAVGWVLGWYRQRTGSMPGVVAARVLLVLLMYLVLPTLWP